MYTVPGPENLQTKPSPDEIPLMIPPEATRSRTYLQFHATRCPLSMMYFSPSTSYINVSIKKKMHCRGRAQLTSFLMIAPKLLNHRRPAPDILYTNRPSPENMALLKL
jgi:hypothetical protein